MPLSFALMIGLVFSSSLTMAKTSSDLAVVVTCTAYQDTNISDMKSKFVGTQRSEDYVLIRYTCKTDTEASNSFDLKPKLAQSVPSCSSASTSTALCVEDSSLPKVRLKKSDVNSSLFVLFRSMDRRQSTVISANLAKLEFSTEESHVSLTSLVKGLSAGVSVGGDVKDSQCQIYMSGARGNYGEALCSGHGCTPASIISVENGKLIFDAMIKGVTGDLAIPQSIQWTGGPNANGVWDSAPVNTPLVVTAKVTTKDGQENECSVRLTQEGQGYSLHVNKYGDCPYFRSVRDYYFLNTDNTAVQTTGYSKPLTLPGFDVQYGANAPDLPFRGILNVAAGLNGVVTVSGGQLVIPSPSARKYSAAVVVARSLDPKTKKVAEPLYWGTLNPANYESTVMRPLSAEPSDDTLLVFQFYLAATEIQGESDLRGTANGTPYQTFAEARHGVPFDRLVPVVNDSCSPIFQIRAPARSDKELPQAMKDAVTCAFSRPFKASELKAGRAFVTVTHFTAESGGDLFPLDLLQGEPMKNVSNSTGTNGKSTFLNTRDVACWQIHPNFGAPNWVTGSSTPPTSSSIIARNDTDECSMMKVTTSTSGGSTMGVRWNTAAMSWGMQFAEQVRSSGVGSVTKWSDLGVSLAAMLGVTAAGGNATLAKASESQIYKQNFAVRFWGHVTSDVMHDETGEGRDMSAYGGNIVAAYTAPICPGSQFEYQNISMSWSPLLIDLEGQGINISRIFPRSVGFDIKGNGYRSFVDWPENTKDVAFLVLPDGEGKVKSMKELFGDLGFENGFANLASYDSNKDGRIDVEDQIFSKLRLWLDENRDGLAQESELVPLASKGVTLISLKYAQPGRAPSAEEKTLTGLYYNSRKKQLMNVEDHYFYEYVDQRRVQREMKPLRTAQSPRK